MPAYAVVLAVPLDAADTARLKELYPDHYQMDTFTWLVKALQTTQQVSEALFPPPADIAQVKRHAVFGITTWWGWHDRAMWEWLDLKAKS